MAKRLSAPSRVISTVGVGTVPLIWIKKPSPVVTTPLRIAAAPVPVLPWTRLAVAVGAGKAPVGGAVPWLRGGSCTAHWLGRMPCTRTS